MTSVSLFFYGATTENNILFELDVKVGDTVVFFKWRTAIELSN